MPHEQQVTVAPPESVDAHTVGEFESALSATDPTSSVRVDCSAVTFMDSSGLRALVAAHNRANAVGGAVRVVRPSPFVQRLLDISGLGELLIGDDAAP